MLTQLNRLSRRELLPALGALLLPSRLLSSENETVLRGRLSPAPAQAEPEQPLTFLTTEGQKYRVSGDSISNAQLRDPLLADREWELVGTVQPDGSFEIVKLFTVKDGKRYRVTYYCDICHIVTHEPGDCMCCQKVTELREIPAE